MSIATATTHTGMTVLSAPRTEPAVADFSPAPVSRLSAFAPRRAREAAPEPDRYVQATLAVDFRHPTTDTQFGPQATSHRDLPEVEPWARGLIQVMMEVMDGMRPADQLRRWVLPEVFNRLARRGILARQRRQRQRHAPRVRSLHTCHPTDGVAEVAAVVQHNGRPRAFALRFNGADGRWVLTALEMG